MTPEVNDSFCSFYSLRREFASGAGLLSKPVLLYMANVTGL